MGCDHLWPLWPFWPFDHIPHINLLVFNPSSPKGGCTNPPNGYRPGAQNRTAKG